MDQNTLNESLDISTFKTTVKTFEAYTTIIRATNTTAYATGQLICGTQASNMAGAVSGYDGSTLIPIELSYFGAVAGQTVQITEARVISNQNPATSILVPKLQLFKYPLSGLSDAMAFAPTFANIGNYFQSNITELYTTENFSTNGYHVLADGLSKLATVRIDESNPDQARLYAALIAQNAYTPKSGEALIIKIKGFLL